MPGFDRSIQTVPEGGTVIPTARSGLVIAILVVLLSGLSSGLVNDGVSGLQRLPVTAFAFAEGTKTDSAFSRSTVNVSQAEAWKDRADATPFGNMLINAKATTAAGAQLPIDLEAGPLVLAALLLIGLGLAGSASPPCLRRRR